MHEDDRGVGGVDRPELSFQTVARQLDDCARQLNAGRAAANDHERHPCPALRWIICAFGPFERREQPSSDLDCVFNRLEARSILGPVVHTEIAVLRAGCENKIVVGQAVTADHNFAAWRTHADDLA